MKKFLIKNAKFVSGKTMDIFIEEGIIKKVAPSIEEKDIQTIEFEDDDYVSAGWIDAHTHCFEKFEIYADNCEEIGYKKGVTTVIDAGTAGADNVGEFYDSVKNCKTHVYSLLNISKTGIYAQNELADMNNIDVDKFIEAYHHYPDFIIGVKARMSQSVVGNNGDLPLFKAKEIADTVHLPLMVHIGSAPSSLETVLKTLRPKDIVTHIFNPKSNGIVENGHIKECVYDATKKGVYLDLGHGTESFSFDVLKTAHKHHIKVNSISSDIYHKNRKNGPVYDLATTMTKLYHCGYSLQEVIDAVTSQPAQMLGLNRIGKIEEGYCGELTIFKIVHQDKELVDSTGKKIKVSSYIQPTAVILRDELISLRRLDNECL